MAKLIRLPNGDDIDPEAVVHIKTLSVSRYEATNTVLPDRVVITGNWGLYEELWCESREAAQTLHDDIARRCNEARSD